MYEESAEKNTTINQGISDRQISDEKTAEKGDSEFQDKIGPILNDMKKMTETNSRSSRNVENLTIAIATLTIVSIILGAASLTIASADEIFSIFSGGIIVLCWTIGIVATTIGVIIALIIFDRDDYIPQKPALSHIKQYKKYGHLQMNTGTLIAVSLYLLGFAYVFISIFIADNSDPNLTFSPSLIVIIVISCIIFIIFWKKYYSQTKSRWSYYYPLIFIPLIIDIYLLFFHPNGVDISTSYVGLGMLIYGYLLVALCIKVSVTIIIIPFRYQLSVEDWYEYKSDETHVGVIVAINSRNPLSFYEIWVKKLVKHLLRSEENPYRVYFCATKEEVQTQFNNSLIHDFWIFGSGDENKLNLSNGEFYYDSWIKKENLASKNIHRVLKRKDVIEYISNWESKHGE
ncbi:MAG: hypothetical protein PHQ11_17475 [Paludibacter sp.]|jgi:hypothetical protein|nr:hypothetical protein [Paludibacter sp.]